MWRGREVEDIKFICALKKLPQQRRVKQNWATSRTHVDTHALTEGAACLSGHGGAGMN